MDAVTLLVAALAVYRVARALAWEDGPARLLARLRAGAATEFDQAGQPTNPLGALLACPLCLSVWLAVPVTLLLLLWPAGAGWLLLPLALSGAATIVLCREADNGL
jgi:cytochrome b